WCRWSRSRRLRTRPARRPRPASASVRECCPERTCLAPCRPHRTAALRRRDRLHPSSVVRSSAMSADSLHVTQGFRLVLGPSAALEEAFLAAVAMVRKRSPLAPLDVLVGGVLQRPYLQRRIADTSSGLLNVRFSTLGELGLRLGEPTLAASGRRPLPAIAERAYTAEVARGCAGYFAPVASTPGFAEAARRLLR